MQWLINPCQSKHICKPYKADPQKPMLKAFGTKEPALFLRFRGTPCFIIHSIQFYTIKTKSERTVWGLPAGDRVITFVPPLVPLTSGEKLIVVN